MIEIERLSKTYPRANGGLEVLKSISFQVAAGEFIAVRGASGSGKSTLLNILGCLDQATSGTYRLDGEAVSGCSDRQLSSIRNAKVGFVFQSFNLLPRTTALENVELPMVYRDGRVDSAWALSLLGRVGLADRATHYATELSGGEQQRVAVARALVNDPAIILADEPTGNLDSAAGLEVMRLLTELHREGRTILIVTHDDAVAGHASREILLRNGTVVSDRGSRALQPGEGAAR